MKDTYIPHHHLYPTNPQILHHLVLELFVRAPIYEQQTAGFPSLMPAGPIYKYGGVLAEGRKQIFQQHPPYTTLVLIAGSQLPLDIAGVITTDRQFHSFFGTLVLQTNNYMGGMSVNKKIFDEHAKGLEAQIPFIRGYRHVDNVVPYIINVAKDQIVVDDLLDSIYAHHGDDACYVYIQPSVGVEKFLSYFEAVSE